MNAWAFAALVALGLGAGAAGHAIGALRTRLTGERQLRQARAQLREHAVLQDSWLWHTDADHRLRSWQGPGQPALAQNAPASLLESPLFADAMLLSRLQAGQAFTGLRLRAATPLHGSHGWDLRGVPRHDDLGRFCGFAGSARPCDDTDAQQAQQAALAAVLQAHAAPALLALPGDDGVWRVQQCNAEAKALWPRTEAGADLLLLAATLPADIAAALLTPGQPADCDGWRLRPFSPGPGLVLMQQGTATAQPGDAAESDSFSFTVSHDLRAPIRVVEGFTRIVKEDYGRLLDRVGNDHLDRVLGAAARMNLMIDALLTLARLSSQPLARQPVNLSQLATYVIDDLQRSAPEREVEVVIEPGLATQGDPTLLRLVLENLLGNAWKYSTRVAKAQVSLACVPHGERSAYVVRDNGAGFDMRSADRLFGLFQRLHSASEFPGHGVGLASVRRIVRRHGGDIWAEAEPGRGAAFYFTLAG